MKTFFKRIYRFGASTQLMLILVALLVFFMVLGTIFPQGGSLEDYIRAFGHRTFMRLAPLGVLDIFHTWYFIAVGVMLYVNLFLCLLRRGITRRRAHAPFRAKPTGGHQIPAGDFAAVKNGLRKLGFRYRVAFDNDKAASLIARRGFPRQLVSTCFHFFFGISIIGFVLSAVTKFEGSIDFEVGDVHSVPTASEDMALYRFFREFDPSNVKFIELELKDYEMQYVPSRMGYFPRDYISTLVARCGDREKEMRVEVNRPLKFSRLTFFQWSYTQRFDLVVDEDTISLEAGDEFPLDGIGGMFMTRTVFVGKVFSEEGVSDLVPYTKLYYREAGGWEELAKLVEDEPVEIMGKKMVLQDVREVSGIFYKRDDGVPLLYAAFFLFLFTICLRIFFHSYEIRIYYDKPARLAYAKGKASGLGSSIERKMDEIDRAFAGKV